MQLTPLFAAQKKKINFFHFLVHSILLNQLIDFSFSCEYELKLMPFKKIKMNSIKLIISCMQFKYFAGHSHSGLFHEKYQMLHQLETHERSLIQIIEVTRRHKYQCSFSFLAPLITPRYKKIEAHKRTHLINLTSFMFPNS